MRRAASASVTSAAVIAPPVAAVAPPAAACLVLPSSRVLCPDGGHPAGDGYSLFSVVSSYEV